MADETERSEVDWTDPEAWAPDGGGRPFRGVDPEGLEDEERLLAGHAALKRAVARQREEVERLRREMPKAEARGEPAIERLREAEDELERLEAVERNWSGPAQRAKERRQRRRRVEGARKAREGIEDELERLLEARSAYNAARQRVRSKLSRLADVLRDGDLRTEVEPLPRALVERIRRVASRETNLAAGADLDVLPVKGEDAAEDEQKGPSRRVVERGTEVLLVPAEAWSDEEVEVKKGEFRDRTVRRAAAEEVA